MARRKQKISREKTRTMWLAWSAWLFIGGIFVFEDTQGGTGWLTWTLTAPFWLAFVVWPFLWGYLATRRNPDYVEIDDDIRTDDSVCRLVQKDGVRYAEKASLLSAFDIRGALPTQTLAGGTEQETCCVACRCRFDCLAPLLLLTLAAAFHGVKRNLNGPRKNLSGLGWREWIAPPDGAFYRRIESRKARTFL